MRNTQKLCRWLFHTKVVLIAGVGFFTDALVCIFILDILD